MTRVVVTGIGAVSPLGNDVPSTWQALLAGRSGIANVTLFDTSAYDYAIAGEVRDFVADPAIPVKDLRHVDRFSQFAISAALEAARDSGLPYESGLGERSGVVFGSGAGGYTLLAEQTRILDHKGPRRVSPFFLTNILPDFATTTNPIDITAALLTNSRLFSDILPVLAKDPAADAFLIGIPVAGQGYDVNTFARDSAEFARATGKPLVMAVPQASIAAKFMEQGLPVFTAEAEAVAALNQFLSHCERCRTLANAVPWRTRSPGYGGKAAQRGAEPGTGGACRRSGGRASLVRIGGRSRGGYGRAGRSGRGERLFIRRGTQVRAGAGAAWSR
jgi:hypothetical protein